MSDDAPCEDKNETREVLTPPCEDNLPAGFRHRRSGLSYVTVPVALTPPCRDDLPF